MKTKSKNASTISRSPAAGKTKYYRLGTIVERAASSKERRSNSRPQFEQRQRMRHAIALWRAIAPCKPMFTGHRIAYNGFLSLANLLPAVYMHSKSLNGSSLLMPDIPVSEGTIRPFVLQIGVVDGTAALITNLKACDLNPYEDILLYSAEQRVEGGYPWVVFNVREVYRSEFSEADGFLALVDDDFANEMKGWALVRVNGKRCSSQGIVTRCTYYKQFTTEEALQKAAKNYGGLTRG